MRGVGVSLMGMLSLWVAWELVVRYALLPLGQGLTANLAMSFRSNATWIYLHVFCASVALLVGAWQFVPGIRRRLPNWHRSAGRVYLLVGVGLGGGAALVLGFLSSSGRIAQLGFMVGAGLWLYTGWQGYLAARERRIDAHRRFMVYNFAISFGAVMLRIYLAAVFITGVPFELMYPWIAWLSWAGNLTVAHALMQHRASSKGAVSLRHQSWDSSS